MRLDGFRPEVNQRTRFSDCSGGPRRTRRIAFAALLALVVSSAACAGRFSPPGPVIADRPGYTDTPTVLPPGAVQVESGITDDHPAFGRYLTAGELLVRVGIDDDLELRIFGNSFATRTIGAKPSEGGFEDPKIGFKANGYSKPDSVHSFGPNLSFLAAVTLPHGSGKLSAGKAQPEAKFAASWTTPTPLSIYSNIAVSHLYDGAEWHLVQSASTALWYAVNPTISLFGEGITYRSMSGGALSSTLIDGGITYLLNDRLQLDFRAGRGLDGLAKGDHFLGAGIATRW